VNLLLRSYIAHKEFEAARALLSKVHFPEAASTTQLVRFLYYTGRVKAVQLEYSAAHSALLQASRKAPSGAHAIQTAITAFLVTVELLMGDIPERTLFARAPLTLHPYMAVTRSMRNGNLGEFWGAMASHAPVFAATGTLTLLRRLEANVIRTGLRRVAAAYSTISFQDIARRLNLGGGEEAEFMCAKAVKDGVLDAVLDHTLGVLVCQPRRNVYCTREPQEAFHRRITFCLDVHNEAVQAMRYRPRAVRSDLESAEAKIAREKEEEALEEFMKMEGEEEEDDEM
jgi:26S proteasome regulatory subunit N3